MENNLKLVLEEFELYKGQFVIIWEKEVVRLVGVAEDQDDYYYLCWSGRSPKLQWVICLSRLIPLKGFIREKDYQELIRIARLNDWDQIQTDPVMKLKLLNDLVKFDNEDEKLLAPPCWDLK
jgi:hypothetical protein